MRRLLISLILFSTGCSMLPRVTHRPVVRNPFPELTRVAVAPFFNLSTEASVNGRQFALAYFNELQLVPGFEVVPIGVVESKLSEYGLSLASAEDARKLAQLLGVDAVVVGAVTDFSPYYPPRCALRVEWYAANPCFHPILPGYGLPWGEPQEEEIPEPLVYEKELADARRELKARTPLPPPLLPAPLSPAPSPEVELLPPPTNQSNPDGEGLAATATLPADEIALPAALPCLPSNEPVLRHTRTYNGHDFEVTQRLKEYAYYRDDERGGGWESYLTRSDDFVRFCCHLHLMEMLTARGGGDESQVVWRWPKSR